MWDIYQPNQYLGRDLMQPGDTFYWISLQRLEDWEIGTRLIRKSRVRSFHIPTGMYESDRGKYFYSEDCYSSLEEARVALKSWVQRQREMLDSIEQELGEY